MSNLQPPNFEPELSDMRTRTTPTSGYTSTSALSRRNANRINRRQDRSREQLQTSGRYRVRRIGAIRHRSSLSPPSLASQSQDEPATKRRRTEKSGPQAEMEQLPMMLKHCDGGALDRDYSGRLRSYSNQYVPECALRDDSSVYCSKNRKCNMILQHVDGQCFSLQRLVVRAPPAGFTCPVRAGMIFVAMDDRDLLIRTNYTIRYESEDDDSSDDEALDYMDMEPCEEEDEEDHEPDASESLPRASVFSPAIFTTFPFTPGPVSAVRPPIHTSVPPQSLWASLEEQLSAPVELLKPDAVFTQQDGRTKFVIDFNPPISGKYILAKFFCPQRDDDNIDIEFIGAYGWVGRRFFPSVTMR